MIRFLSSVYFAALLLTLLALSVMAATFIEGAYDSHSLASQWVYSHPLFNLLLAAFFLNIFLSAARRYPYKLHHLPFLTTHLGLLMIIAGTMGKNFYGLQGTLLIKEGSGSHSLIVKESQGVTLESITGNNYSYPLNTHSSSGFESTAASPVSLQLKRYIPHVHPSYQTFIQGSFGAFLKLENLFGKTFASKTFKTNDINQAIQKFLEENLKVHLNDPLDNKTIFRGTLQELLKTSFEEMRFELFLENFENKLLLVYPNHTYQMPLTGVTRQIHPFYFEDYPPNPPFEFHFQCEPTALFLTDSKNSAFVLINEDGSIYQQIQSNKELSSYFAYERGYDGYSIEVPIPEDFFYTADKRLEILFNDFDEIKQSGLSPEFLWIWQKYGTWLFPESVNLSIDFDEPKEYRSAAQWTALITTFMESDSEALKKLEAKGWPPLINSGNSKKEQLYKITQQIFDLKNQLPAIEHPISQATFASILLRLQNFSPASAFNKNLKTKTKSLEAPLTLSFSPTDEITASPGILLEIKEGLITETISLPFDETGTLLKTPALQGKYLVKFGALKKELPYHVYLKKAYKIDYPDTSQPASYEADIMVTYLGEKKTPFHLQMNQVYESQEGYRFYLSGIQGGPDQAKTASIVVNYDPFKTAITYPGALFVTLGTLALLFWRRKK